MVHEQHSTPCRRQVIRRCATGRASADYESIVSHFARTATAELSSSNADYAHLSFLFPAPVAVNGYRSVHCEAKFPPMSARRQLGYFDGSMRDRLSRGELTEFAQSLPIGAV